MAKQRLPDDFKDFLKSFNAHEVRSLLVGGHAVGAPRKWPTSKDCAIDLRASRGTLMLV
jgi:hypothetical protein